MFFQPTIIKKLQKANLIGRGCNNFPVADKWLAVRNAPTKMDKFVICNISESEPGMFKDEYILKNQTEKVIEGIKIAMDFVGAKKGFIYLNPAYYQSYQDYLKAEIEAQKVNIELYEKPLHDYIGGEETALLNSMQGLRVEPRLKPPFPTTDGFFNQPTLINNCETFYTVALIKANQYKNTKFYCLSEADVNSDKDAKSCVSTNHGQGLILELPIDITVKKALEAFNHKPSDKYFYQVGGGAAGTCYNFRQLQRPFGNNAAAIIVYPKNKPEKEIILHFAQFFKDESCGQCVPCREGTYRLLKLLEKKYAGELVDQNLIDDLIFNLQKSSFCALGKVATNAMTSYWKNIHPVT
ncbi:MAG TPA: NADH-ubiquinone oxidoreductase-F iron-sulfur binding region domain-containing protein [bacterium]|nr:NADH-ubiquinone oxidoreductase-F iron-sulfur binding region domain-containing protein [bacterium]